MEPSPIPVTSVKTGVIKEERSFDWEISNLLVVLNHSAMIGSQQFEFYAGESIGMASKWRAYLQESERDGRSWVGLFIALKERPVLTSEHLCVQILLTFKTKDGVVKETTDSKVRDFYNAEVVPSAESGYGFPKIFGAKGELPSYMEVNNEGSLVVNIKFRLFALSKAIQPLKVKLEEFQAKSTAKARADLTTMLMENPVPHKDVKIIANDKKEFKMRKDVLSVRSPVFRAMLDTAMTEGIAGKVEIQDMGSESLKTMLHYMSRGELLPEWKSTEVIVELTNAAAKYELTDLLNFLDGVLGDVCNLDNVGMLIALANRLSLKTAEGDLMCFLRRKGTISPGSFLQVVSGVPEEASRASRVEGQSPSCSCACCRGRQGERNADDADEDKGGETSKRKTPKKIRRSQE